MAGLIALTSSSLGYTNYTNSSPGTERRTRSRGGRPWPTVS
jgi:hypothetical protein